ncbi:probable ATP-dependent RNA helicase DDX58 [Anneissia japonica]|uniref:probable ATP-dependent RNA helicase DDX58 n=1 Tax=Anneissia japonica TaxID=1529436 RepID=UPI0014254FD4|nr:probable ATP-dependent RNA helicase DDX58 [Anneissia japonica]
MDEERKLLTVVFRPYLRENLNTTSSFLSLLRGVTVIDKQWADVMKVKELKSPADVVDKILDVLEDCQEDGWFKSFLNALAHDNETPKNKEIQKYITGFKKFEDMSPYKGLLRACVPSLLANVIPRDLLPHLKSLSTEDKQRINQIIDHRCDTEATMELLECIQRGGDEWFKELITALLANNYTELANYLRPPDEETIEDCPNPVSDSSEQTQNEDQETFHEEANNDTNQSEATTLAVDKDVDDVGIAEKDDDGKEKAAKGESKKLNLRNYQKELAKPVIAGENTIIISHTGSGKTVVAVHFINEHFKNGQASNELSDNPDTSGGVVPVEKKPKKVLFLVSTTNLASQQHDLFQSYLQSTLKLCYLIGETAPLKSLKIVVENNDIIFLTAQMVVNALQKNDVTIDDFTMLVFDECHHCHGQNPYNEIMARYRKAKIENGRATLPQVLYADYIGKAFSQQKSDEYAKKIFANLDVEAVSIPNEEDEEYRKFVNPPEEIDPILVEPRSDDDDPFKIEIEGIMVEIETMLKEEVIKKMKKVPQTLLDLLKFTECVKGSSAYEQRVETFRTTCPESVKDDDALLRLLRTGGHYLRVYNDALKMNKICRIKDALNLIKEFIKTEKETRSEGFNNVDKDLIQLFENREKELDFVSGRSRYENPLLTKLQEILTGEFRSKPASHAIIFCTKRVTVDAMHSWIEENEILSEFLKPEKIFGSSEMTSDQQQAVLQNFKSDGCNILVGTNVVEEGTDVPDCNMVFRYNYMSSDVGRKQAKGRIRKKNSKFYMIASTEFDFEKKDQANKVRDLYMIKSVRTLSKIPTEELKADLRVLQQIDVNDRIRMEKLEMEKRERRTIEAYKLFCGKCSAFACFSYDIKVFNDSNHLITDEEFYRERIRTEKHPKAREIGDDTYKYGKVFCKNCSFDWGIMVTISNTNFAVIKIVSFILEKCANGRKTTQRKWKDSPFKVEKLDILEFKSTNSDWSV